MSESILSTSAQFFSSKSSQLAKTRLWLWLGLAIGLVSLAFQRETSVGTILFAAAFALPAVAIGDWLFRRQLKPGEPILTLDGTRIESPNFSGKSKRYFWEEIESADIVSINGAPCLQIFLRPTMWRPDKRRFWCGTNPARPFMPLTPFSREVQERLLEAINLRLAAIRGAPAGAAPVRNMLAEEREFQEKLRSLAPWPWMTYSLIAINVLVWLLTVMTGTGVLQASPEHLLSWGGLAASEVQRGEWWRMLAAPFLHSGLVHLAMNMVGLAGAGITVERIYGRRLFLLIYLGSVLAGSALSLHFAAQAAVSVGASGAVFGVAGALLVAVFEHRKALPKVFGKQTLSGIGFFVFYSLLQGFSQQGIDNGAHVGGLLAGALVAFIAPERFDEDVFRRHFRSRFLAAFAAVAIGCTVLASLAPPAVLDQKTLVEGSRYFERGAKGFDAAAKALQKEHQDVQDGKMNVVELDERSRTDHAPAFRRVFDDLSRVVLRPGDPQESFLKEFRTMSELMGESLAMPSFIDVDSGKPVPADPARMAALEAEIAAAGARLQKLTEEDRAKQKP